MDLRTWHRNRLARPAKMRSLEPHGLTHASELTDRLATSLRQKPNVLSACLARAAIGAEGVSRVAIFVRTEVGPDLCVTQVVNRSVQSLSPTAIPIDVIFIDEEEERKLGSACAPFFGRRFR